MKLLMELSKNTILKFIRPSPNNLIKYHKTRLRLGLSHLGEHIFKQSFQDSLNPLCNCSFEVESTIVGKREYCRRPQVSRQMPIIDLKRVGRCCLSIFTLGHVNPLPRLSVHHC